MQYNTIFQTFFSESHRRHEANINAASTPASTASSLSEL
jgi:hypothetical protein